MEALQKAKIVNRDQTLIAVLRCQNAEADHASGDSYDLEIRTPASGDSFDLEVSLHDAVRLTSCFTVAIRVLADVNDVSLCRRIHMSKMTTMSADHDKHWTF
jgi:hypothetical protein